MSQASRLLLRLGHYGSSRRTHSSFSSFFFHNAQWIAPAPQPYPKVQLPPLRTSSSAFKSVPSLSLLSSPRKLLSVYTELTKGQLAVLNVLVTMSSFAVCPLPSTLPTLLSTALGTTFCIASANTFNQIQEIPFDAQMARTRNRPLVRRAISPGHAAAFGVATGVAGPLVLWTMVNPATAILGLSNIALYAWAYTAMKRRTIWNTWVGAIVGAIPPLMGWTACGGSILPSLDHPFLFFLPTASFSSPLTEAPAHLIDNPLAPLALALLMFSWQFPHFNSLAHCVRASYAQAGYKMLCVLSPPKNRLVSLRHSLLLLPICSALVPLSGLTTWVFAFTSLPANAVLVRAAWRFWRTGTEKDARIVFRHSLWYLPVVFGLMMVHKQGVDWLAWFRESVEDEEQEDTKT